MQSPLNFKFDFDTIVIGGGLSGALVAYRCALEGRRVLILEKDFLGGNKTWSFHRSDVSEKVFSWLSHFISFSWNGYEVRFPKNNRLLSCEYHSITQKKLSSVIESHPNIHVCTKVEVQNSTRNYAELLNGERVQAKQVWDTRPNTSQRQGDYRFQKFLGLDLEVKTNHGVKHPRIMDATVLQHDGFRFLYVLPWDSKRLLIEDTYYSDSPVINKSVLRKRVEEYAQKQGWEIQSIEREETGCLPIPLTFPKFSKASENGIGYAAGLFHPTTGYSVSFAAKTAEWIASQNRFFDDQLAADWAAKKRKLVKRAMPCILLNRLLFSVAEAKRYRILEHFYRLPEPVIARFYSGEFRFTDFVQILSRGKPPMPPLEALKALFFTRYEKA